MNLCINGRFLIAFTCLLSLLPALLANLDKSPKIITLGGNVILESGINRNISIRLNGRSRFVVNDFDLLELLGKDKSVLNVDDEQLIDGARLRNLKLKLMIMRNRMFGEHGFDQRLRQIENRTRGVSPVVMLRRTHRRVVDLEFKYDKLITQLKADSCASNPCANGGSCIALFDGFVCKCTKGFEGSTCSTDVNECGLFAGTELGCQNGAQCINQFGSYSCICNSGWQGIHCNQRKTDCLHSSNTELCGHGTCVNANDNFGYRCICEQGWKSNGLTPSCTVDVDECSQYSNPCATKCINLQGGFMCAPCDPGYTGNGLSCRDIDECATNNGGCSTSPFVPCINTFGSFHCGACPIGWAGDGRICTRSEGASCRTTRICHPSALCQEVANSISCICPAGMVGNGVGPNGCSSSGSNVCSSNPCLNGGTCMNSGNGLFTCLCPIGFRLPNCQRPYNPCSSNPCLNGGTCRQRGSTFTCDCIAGYSGRLCDTQRSRCGQYLYGDRGNLKYPLTSLYNHNAQCSWVIRTNETKVLNVTFTKFEIEDSPECHFDWLQMHDGPTAASQLLGRFCGSKPPLNGNIITTTNRIYLWFKSDNSSAKAGFELSWTSIDPICGGLVEFDSHTTIASPGSPGNYPRNRDCRWHLKTPNTNRIKLIFFRLQIETHSDCIHDYLEITDAISSTRLEMFCNSSNPAPLIVPSNEIVLHFHSDNEGSDLGFQIHASTVERIPGCGGIYTERNGDIASPQNIDSLISCEYTIRYPIGLRVQLTMKDFRMGDDDCIEISNFKTGSDEFIGKWCGKMNVPTIKSTGNELNIKFYSTGGTFRLTYSTICIYTFEESFGVIKSPNYPSSYPPNEVCTFEIIGDSTQVISLQFIDMDLENQTSGGFCYYDYILIYDGINQTAAGPFCSNPPSLILSKSSLLKIVLRTDSSVSGRGFKANYNIIDTTAECGGIIRKPSGEIRLPKLINEGGYKHDLRCSWIIVAPPGMAIQITWVSFELEFSNDCIYDYVMIVINPDSANTDGDSRRYCGSTPPPTILNPSNMLKLVFVSDSTDTAAGFLAKYNFIDESTLCGGTFFSSTGVAMSPNWPNEYPSNLNCSWIITVMSGYQIELIVEPMDLEESSNCTNDWLQIRNGRFASSPLIGTYCGTTIPHSIRSFTHQLHIKFVTNSQVEKTGFRMKWQMTAAGCGGTLFTNQGTITSPGYPENYDNDSECEWKITINEGSTISISITDISFEDIVSCSYDYLEVIDGPTANSRKIGTYCSLGENKSPIQIETTKNEALIRFKSDSSSTENGFYLTYKYNCSRELYDPHGAIESPNFGTDNNPTDVNCTWTIKAPKGNQIELDFLLVGSKNSNGEANPIYVSEVGSNPIWKIRKPQRIMSRGSEIVISLNSSATYFRLEYAMRGCINKFHRESGEFVSPQQSNISAEVECLYHIETVPGKAIELVILKLEIEDTPDCVQESLTVSMLEQMKGKTLVICGRRTNITVTSSTNVLSLKFRAKNLNGNKGFSVKYKTVDLKCGGLFRLSEGVIQSPNYPVNYDANLYCEWRIESAEHSTLNITVEELDVENSYMCFLDSLVIYDGGDTNSNELGRLCGESYPSDSPLITTSNKALIVFETDADTESKGFKISFKENCAKRYVVNDTGSIQFIGTGRSEICKWNIIAEDRSKHVTFMTTHVHFYDSSNKMPHSNDDCIKIFDGDLKNTSHTQPRVKFCSQHAESVTSFGNALTVELNSAYLVQFDGFFTIMDNHCGGTFSSPRGTFSSPSYPLSYPINIECIWEIKATEGNAMKLVIQQMDIDRTDDCNGDYLEIREGNDEGRLIGVFCGNDVPGPLTALHGLWVKFSSDDDVVRSGFIADYSYAYLTELNGTEGVIMSPHYPHEIHSLHKWVIRVPRGSMIMAIIETVTQNLHFFDSEDGSTTDVIEPDGRIVRSTTNVLTISFRTGSFKLHWYQVNKEFMTGNSTAIDNSTFCHNKIINVGFHPVRFSSPDYPNGYDSNVNCSWIISPAELGYHAFISFNHIDLESNNDCDYDRVLIHSSIDMINWKQLDKQCKKTSNKVLEYTGDRFLKVEFLTDYGVNGTGFDADASMKCGSIIKAKSGWINATLYSRVQPDCEWKIQVSPGRKIKLNFARTIWNTRLPGCESYLLLKNGISDDSPKLGDGKYCMNVIPDIPLSSSSSVYVKIHNSFTSYVNWINFYFEEVMSECFHTIYLDERNSSTLISSDNYPNIPNAHSRCVWVFNAPVDRIISVEFSHPMELQPSPFCDLEYVELHDGGSDLSPVIGRFCGKSVPNSQSSSGHMLRLTYFTDIAEPHIGFQARVSLGLCGGTYRESKGVISSIPLVTGRSNITCEYRILMPEGHGVNITIDSINLPLSANCSEVNHLEIEPIYPEEEIREETHYVCQTSEYTVFKQLFDINEVRIRYQILSPNFDKDKFKIHYNSISHRCGQTFEAQSGVLKTPGYIAPVDYPSRCVWKIKVPKGRRVKLEFMDYIGATADNSLHPRFISRCLISNDFEMKSIIARVNQNPPRVLYSTDNMMSIVSFAMPMSSRQGYKMRFSSDEYSELCYENFHYASGDITFKPTDNSSVFCRYEIDVSQNMTFALTINTIDLYRGVFENAHICLRYGPLAVESLSQEWRRVWFCENRNETTIRLPFSFSLEILRNSFNNLTSLDFKYARHKCGGIFTIGDQFEITLPNVSIPNPGAMDCAWKVVSSPGDLDQFEVSVYVNFKLKCDEEYLILHSDMNGDMPRLGRFCDKASPMSLIAERDIFIEYHTSNYDPESDFYLTASVSAGCGGLITYPFRSIKFKQQYQNNVECIWTIQSSTAYHIGVIFSEYFFIESSPNCTKDYILIQEQLGTGQDEWRNIRRVCGREPPPYVNTTTQTMRFIFRSDEAVTGEGFTAYFERNCGGSYNATADMQILTSPNYPSAYESNLTCNYTIYPSRPGKALLLRITDFNLEDSPKYTCDFDNLTVYRENEEPVTLCGYKKEEEFRSTLPITLVFKSDGSYNRKGFSLEYGDEDCGGTITESTYITTPKLKANSNYPPNTMCVWNITTSEDYKIVVKFEWFQFESAHACNYDYVELFDGKIPSESQRLAKLCGNLTDKMPPITFGSNFGVIRSTSDTTEHSVGFSAYVNIAKKCDKTIRLEMNDRPYNLTYSGYENNLDCAFIFMTDPGYSFILSFTNFHIEESPTCRMDYIEIRDGTGPFADQIGQYCGHEIPRSITSSGPALYVHFVTDASETSAGFTASISVVPQVCGAHDLMLTANETTVIAIGDGGKYQPNMNCFWRLRGERNIRLDFEKFDLQESLENGTCTGDYLRIYNRKPFSTVETVFGSEFIFNGESSSVADSPYEPFGTDHTFCGHGHPNSYYVNNKEVFIKFFSDSSIEGSGFKIVATTINDCMKNFTATQGRVHAVDYNKCEIYIYAPQNYSISIYFDDVGYYSYSEADLAEIFDVRHNRTSLKVLKGTMDPYNSVFTNSNQILVKILEQSSSYPFDLTFLASNQGPGCGGDLFSDKGVFTSPLYRNQNRSTFDCRWNIKVPNNMRVLLEFRSFDLGSKVNCHSDYLQILELEPSSRYGVTNRTGEVVRQFCGEDSPSEYIGRRNILSVRYRRSANFNGIGWVIRFSGTWRI